MYNSSPRQVGHDYQQVFNVFSRKFTHNGTHFLVNESFFAHPLCFRCRLSKHNDVFWNNLTLFNDYFSFYSLKMYLILTINVLHKDGYMLSVWTHYRMTWPKWRIINRFGILKSLVCVENTLFVLSLILHTVIFIKY